MTKPIESKNSFKILDLANVSLGKCFNRIYLGTFQNRMRDTSSKIAETVDATGITLVLQDNSSSLYHNIKDTLTTNDTRNVSNRQNPEKIVDASQEIENFFG